MSDANPNLPRAPRGLVIGTAGHIDHGKSALVRALTGTDPDRLKEEKERGITIDLGFAFTTLPDGTRLAFVDVPGHERFVKNMLAGAGGIDAALLVVAADESVMPQTREHLDILVLLGIRAGLVVLTKASLADADMRALARMEVGEVTKGTFLQDAPILAVDSITREGLPELLAELARLAGSVKARPTDRTFRLPVDRAFAMRGFGTVVTGTASGGVLPLGSVVQIFPSGRASRVRHVEVAGEERPEACAGERTALNLPDVQVAEIARGDVVAPEDSLAPTTTLHAKLRVLPGSPVPIKGRDRLRLHLGAAEILTRVRILRGGPALQPGSEGLATLSLETPTVAVWRDRFVVRSYSPLLTIGGGTIILPGEPPGPRRKPAALVEVLSEIERADIAGAAIALVRAAGAHGLLLKELSRPLGLPEDAIVPNLKPALAAGALCATETGRLVFSRALDEPCRGVREAVRQYHRAQPLEPGAPREQVRQTVLPHVPGDVFRVVLGRLEREGVMVQDREVLRMADFRVRPSDDEDADLARLERLFKDAGANPPSREEALKALGIAAVRGEGLIALLLRRGSLRRIGGSLIFHAQVLDGIADKVRHRGATKPSLTVPEFKELSGTSRKYAIPLLEYLDSRLVTERRGDVRRILTASAGRTDSLQ